MLDQHYILSTTLFYRGYQVDDSIESLNFSLRKIIKNQAAFPNDDAVFRLIFLSLQPASQKWTMPIKNWKTALQQLALLLEDQITLDALMAINS